MTDRADNKVKFTPRQVAYLNEMFPEVPGTHNTSDHELRWRAAQRAVVAFVRSHEDKGR